MDEKDYWTYTSYRQSQSQRMECTMVRRLMEVMMKQTVDLSIHVLRRSSSLLQ
jgi:hypothetical protein